jgi:hypothetical protein
LKKLKTFTTQKHRNIFLSEALFYLMGQRSKIIESTGSIRGNRAGRVDFCFQFRSYEKMVVPKTGLLNR